MARDSKTEEQRLINYSMEMVAHEIRTVVLHSKLDLSARPNMKLLEIAHEFDIRPASDLTIKIAREKIQVTKLKFNPL